MVSQTHPVELDEQEEAPLRSVARNTSEFAEDVLTLAELQAKLLMLESKEWAQLQFRFAALGVAGLAVAVGLVPIAFLTIAAMIVESTALSFAQALILSLILGVLLSGGLLLGAYSETKTKTTSFARSSREWDANFRWIRNMLRRQGRRW